MTILKRKQVEYQIEELERTIGNLSFAREFVLAMSNQRLSDLLMDLIDLTKTLEFQVEDVVKSLREVLDGRAK